jgi:hypothetical protein
MRSLVGTGSSCQRALGSAQSCVDGSIPPRSPLRSGLRRHGGNTLVSREVDAVGGEIRADEKHVFLHSASLTNPASPACGNFDRDTARRRRAARLNYSRRRRRPRREIQPREPHGPSCPARPDLVRLRYPLPHRSGLRRLLHVRCLDDHLRGLSQAWPAHHQSGDRGKCNVQCPHFYDDPPLRSSS